MFLRIPQMYNTTEWYAIIMSMELFLVNFLGQQILFLNDKII